MKSTPRFPAATVSATVGLLHDSVHRPVSAPRHPQGRTERVLGCRYGLMLNLITRMLRNSYTLVSNKNQNITYADNLYRATVYQILFSCIKKNIKNQTKKEVAYVLKNHDILC